MHGFGYKNSKISLKNYSFETISILDYISLPSYFLLFRNHTYYIFLAIMEVEFSNF